MVSPAPERVLVLLRGINVGGRHIVPMAALRTLFSELGCDAVATYIQSGNLVCTAPAELSAGRIAEALQIHFGFAIPVTLRTLGEFEAAVAANPFLPSDGTEGASEDTVHLVFLDGPLAPAILAQLEAKRGQNERLASIGQELFLYLPGGFGRSKLAIACTAPSMPGSLTVRNWKTVLQLAAMMRS